MAEGILAGEPSPYIEGDYALRVVRMRGRVTGAQHEIALAVFTWHGRRYLVSPRAERNWARNLCADGRCVLMSRDGAEQCRAERVGDPDVAAEVAARYVEKINAPWATAQFPFQADTPAEDIAAVSDLFSVFILRADEDNPNRAPTERPGVTPRAGSAGR
jgi:hypothetical protein